MSEKSTGLSKKSLSWLGQLRASFKTPLGMFGVGITTIFAILILFGVIAHTAGMVRNPYASIITFALFPTGMLIGLLIMPLAAFLQRRKMFSRSLTREGLLIDFSNAQHRKILFFVLILTVVNIALFASVAYEGYRFMDNPTFCGTVCHTVMAPEYTAHERYPHANVECVECHIAPGIGGFFRAKFSGLRQLADLVTGDYHRPIPIPVKNLPPASKTCENCHSPQRYFGDKKKLFVKFTNEDQVHPDKQRIVLHLGGHDPVKDRFKGIHWHADPDITIYYQPLKDDLTKIGAVKVVYKSGKEKMFKTGIPNKDLPWRTMDCIDCHNRPAHVFNDPVKRVNFGLYAGIIPAEIPGIRQDSLTVLHHQYTSRKEAAASILPYLKKLQEKRNGKDFVGQHDKAIDTTAAYLKAEYLKDIWPQMNITWGTYPSEIGHQNAEKGYGCFRCHDEEHLTDAGDSITQDCGLCHKEP